MTLSLEQIEHEIAALRRDLDAFRDSVGKGLMVAADASEQVHALSWEVCRILDGRRHFADDPEARPEMPSAPTLRAVFVHRPYPRVEFIERDTERAAPNWEAERIRDTERAPPKDEP